MADSKTPPRRPLPPGSRSTPRRPPRRPSLAPSIAGLTGVCLLVSLFFWEPILDEVGEFLALSELPSHSDLIVVLGGDFYGPRVLAAAELGVRGYAPRVMISGPPYNDSPESDLAIEFLVKKGYPRDLFFGLPHYAGNTIDEVHALCPALRRLRVRRVTLVTASFHSRRASIDFNLFCPGIDYHSVAAPDQFFHPEHWWLYPPSRRLVGLEWAKIAGSILWKFPAYEIESLLSFRPTWLFLGRPPLPTR